MRFILSAILVASGGVRTVSGSTGGGASGGVPSSSDGAVAALITQIENLIKAPESRTTNKFIADATQFLEKRAEEKAAVNAEMAKLNSAIAGTDLGALTEALNSGLAHHPTNSIGVYYKLEEAKQEWARRMELEISGKQQQIKAELEKAQQSPVLDITLEKCPVLTADLRGSQLAKIQLKANLVNLEIDELKVTAELKKLTLELEEQRQRVEELAQQASEKARALTNEATRGATEEELAKAHSEVRTATKAASEAADIQRSIGAKIKSFEEQLAGIDADMKAIKLKQMETFVAETEADLVKHQEKREENLFLQSTIEDKLRSILETGETTISELVTIGRALLRVCGEGRGGVNCPKQEGEEEGGSSTHRDSSLLRMYEGAVSRFFAKTGQDEAEEDDASRMSSSSSSSAHSNPGQRAMSRPNYKVEEGRDERDEMESDSTKSSTRYSRETLSQSVPMGDDDEAHSGVTRAGEVDELMSIMHKLGLEIPHAENMVGLLTRAGARKPVSLAEEDDFFGLDFSRSHLVSLAGTPRYTTREQRGVPPRQFPLSSRSTFGRDDMSGDELNGPTGVIGGHQGRGKLRLVSFASGPDFSPSSDSSIDSGQSVGRRQKSQSGASSDISVGSFDAPTSGRRHTSSSATGQVPASMGRSSSDSRTGNGLSGFQVIPPLQSRVDLNTLFRNGIAERLAQNVPVASTRGFRTSTVDSGSKRQSLGDMVQLLQNRRIESEPLWYNDSSDGDN
jgi:hypothetical protein